MSERHIMSGILSRDSQGNHVVRINTVNEDGDIVKFREIRNPLTYTFNSTMQLVDMEKDKQKARFIFTDGSILYDMMLPELYHMLRVTAINNGLVAGIWGFTAHGHAVGIKYMGK